MIINDNDELWGPQAMNKLKESVYRRRSQEHDYTDDKRVGSLQDSRQEYLLGGQSSPGSNKM